MNFLKISMEVDTRNAEQALRGINHIKNPRRIEASGSIPSCLIWKERCIGVEFGVYGRQDC